MKCIKCGKELSNEMGETIKGAEITISLEAVSPSMLELFKRSLGKYYIPDCDKYEWSLCLECYLDSLIWILLEGKLTIGKRVFIPDNEDGKK